MKEAARVMIDSCLSVALATVGPEINPNVGRCPGGWTERLGEFGREGADGVEGRV